MSNTNEAGKTAETPREVIEKHCGVDIWGTLLDLAVYACVDYSRQVSAAKDIEIQRLRAALIEIHDGIYVNDVETVVTIITDALKPTE